MKYKMSCFIYILIYFIICSFFSKNYYVYALNSLWPLDRPVKPNSNYSKIFDLVNTDYTVNSLTGIQPNIPEEVSLNQFNEDDLLIISNETLFKRKTDNFINSDSNYIQTLICKDLQDATQSTPADQLKSLYYPGLSTFESLRCVPGNCKIDALWNSTNQNGMDTVTFQTYLASLSYILFPFFLSLIILFTMFSFCNCMYFNYCYLFCFDYTTIRINPMFFKLLFFFVFLFSILYIAIGVFNEWRFSQLTKGRNLVLCQLISTNVYQMIRGVDVTKLNNKDWDPTINWNGLININDSYVSYMNNFLLPFKNNLSKSSFFTSVDYTFNDTKTLYNGLNILNDYILNTSFSFIDSNSVFDPKFNSTYFCQKCKQLRYNINETYYEIKDILGKQKQEYSDFREYLYKLFVEEEGWKKTYKIHNNTLFKIRETIYRSIKFYDFIMNYYSQFSNLFDGAHLTEFLLFILNTIACIGGIGAYSLIEEAVDYANSEEIGENFQFKDVNERKETKVKYRWGFHVVINLNIFTSLYLCCYSVLLLFGGVYIFELSVATKYMFYNQTSQSYNLKNFSFISNGPVIDYCLKENNLGVLLGFSDLYNFYDYLINYTDNFGMKYQNETYTQKCDEFVNQINSLTLSNYIDLNSNGKIYWDPDDEQIMYFLDFKPSYKFWSPPSSVLRQYLDFNYTSYNDSSGKRINITNFQKVCGVNDTLDYWVSTESKCTVEPYAKPRPSYDTYILAQNNQSCLTIDTGLTNTQCQTLLGCEDVACYVSEFIKRYTSNNVFKCKDTNQQTSNYIEIQKFLTQAKAASVLKSKIESQIQQLKDMFNSSFLTPLNNYKQRLKEVQNEYLNLMSQFKLMKGQFINNTNKFIPGTLSVDKEGLLKKSDCSYTNLNDKVFHFLTAFIAEELFGISLTVLGLSLFLYINASLVAVAFFKLRTYREIEMIKWEKDTIREIEQKDLRFFFRPDNYIDSEDYRKYNEIHNENSQIEVKDKKNEQENEHENENEENKNEENKKKEKSKAIPSKDPYKKIPKREDVLLEEQKKFFEEEKEKERKKYNIIYDFIDRYNNYLDKEQKKPKNNAQEKKEDNSQQLEKINISKEPVEINDKDNLSANKDKNEINKDENENNRKDKLNKKSVLFNLPQNEDNNIKKNEVEVDSLKKMRKETEKSNPPSGINEKKEEKSLKSITPSKGSKSKK